VVDGDEEEIAGMGMAMEERRYEAVYVRVYTYKTTMSAAGWSHAVAAVASIHYSQRLFVAARAPNEIFNLKAAP